jgi:cyclophilin family peptidyl-prolyl cis-trans isomerase
MRMGSPILMVDKPGRRKKTGPSRTKIVAVALAVLILGGVSYYSYTVYTAKPAPPVYVRVTVGYLNGTSLGSFDLELFPQYTPQTVANFVSLVKSGFYTDLSWHRIEKGFVIQTGDPNTKNGGGNRSTWGQGTSGTSIPFENATNLHNYQWFVGMASTAQGVGGTSQWYINLVNNTSLDGKYAVFGEVINGTNVVKEVGNVPTEYVTTGNQQGQDEPTTPILITSIYILSTQTTTTL